MRLAASYGNKFLDMWRGLDIDQVKQAWSEDLAGYTSDEILRGLEFCKRSAWPPTLPEFMMACRPVLDAKTEWAEACEQMRIRLIGQGGDVWGRPAVYWAAVSIGMYDLNSTPWEGIKARWTNALSHAKTDPIPEYNAALPAPGKQTVTNEQAADRMKTLLNAVGESLPGTTKSGTAWAYRLMQREAAGESIEHVSVLAWREVLGFDKDVTAKDALAQTERKAA